MIYFGFCPSASTHQRRPLSPPGTACGYELRVRSLSSSCARLRRRARGRPGGPPLALGLGKQEVLYCFCVFFGNSAAPKQTSCIHARTNREGAGSEYWKNEGTSGRYKGRALRPAIAATPPPPPPEEPSELILQEFCCLNKDYQRARARQTARTTAWADGTYTAGAQSVPSRYCSVCSNSQCAVYTSRHKCPHAMSTRISVRRPSC